MELAERGVCLAADWGGAAARSADGVCGAGGGDDGSGGDCGGVGSEDESRDAGGIVAVRRHKFVVGVREHRLEQQNRTGAACCATTRELRGYSGIVSRRAKCRYGGGVLPSRIASHPGVVLDALHDESFAQDAGCAGTFV